jgi:HEAT repeat protein
VPTAARSLLLASVLSLVSGAASAQALLASDPVPAGTDYYGDWMMWWSTNREEYLCRTDPAATSRPVDSENLKPVSGDSCRAQIIPALVHALKDSEKQIREAAAIALGTCGDAQDVATLAKVLGDRDRVVAEAAALGLGMLRTPEAETILGKLIADQATYERKRGIAALALGLSGGDGAQKPLFDGLGSDKSEKYEACRMIGACLWSGGDIGDPRSERCALASNAVVKALKGQEKRRKLVSFGAAAFSKSRDGAAKQFVLAMLNEPRFDVRAAAAISAGRVIQ